jgi:hypothetical protein
VTKRYGEALIPPRSSRVWYLVAATWRANMPDEPPSAILRGSFRRLSLHVFELGRPLRKVHFSMGTFGTTIRSASAIRFCCTSTAADWGRARL